MGVFFFTNQTQYVILEQTGTLGEKMSKPKKSKPTIVDVKCEEVETIAPTLEDRIQALEQVTMALVERHKDVLDRFREMVVAVTKISEENNS